MLRLFLELITNVPSNFEKNQTYIENCSIQDEIKFDSTKKPWKKGSGDYGQVAYLTKKMNRLKK